MSDIQLEILCYKKTKKIETNHWIKIFIGDLYSVYTKYYHIFYILIVFNFSGNSTYTVVAMIMSHTG